MSKVYVIFRGKYEDRIIEAIFSTLQDAEIYCTLHWHDELSDDHPEIEEYYVDNVVYSLKPAIYRGFQFELKKGNKYHKEFFYGHAFLYSRKPIQQSIKETPTTISGIIPVSNRFDFGCDEDLKTDKMLKLIHDRNDLIKQKECLSWLQ